MSIAYIISVLLAVGLYIWLYLTDVKKSLCQNLMVLFIIITNMGYVALGASHNLEEAELAMKIVYVGGCFLPMLYFFIVCEICRVDLAKRTKSYFIVLQIVMYFLVCTIGYNDWFYKKVEFDKDGNVGYLVSEFGWAHIPYIILMVFYFVLAVVFSFSATMNHINVNRKEVRHMSSWVFVAAVLYILQMKNGYTTDLMAYVYLALMYGAIIPIYHSNLYTADENLNVIREEIDNMGFITFDRKLHYMGCNAYAATVLPELDSYRVGYSIGECTQRVNNIMNWVASFKAELKKQNMKGEQLQYKYNFKIRGFYYDAAIRTVLDYHGTCVGYTVLFDDQTEHYTILNMKNQYNEELSEEVDAKTERIREIQHNTILGMAQMVESRDLSTGGHIKRTSDVVKIFADKLLEKNIGYDKDFLELVIRSAPMHDLGKIGVDDAILRKQSGFTDEEFEMMKSHSEIGYRMVKQILTGVEEERFVEVASNVAHYHHEKVNGKGYPTGLKGEEIPIEARIMALADVFDALVSKRCYKDGLSYDTAFSIIEKDTGSHFDAELAEIFMECRPELEAYYDKANNT